MSTNSEMEIGKGLRLLAYFDVKLKELILLFLKGADEKRTNCLINCTVYSVDCIVFRPTVKKR